jgi:disulfide bond formation protein DsbB
MKIEDGEGKGRRRGKEEGGGDKECLGLRLPNGRLQCFFACAGLFFALRQLWLQSLPAGTAPACMPGLDILIRYFPWQDVAHALLWGSGDCAESTWNFLGISMAGWSAVYFSFMALSTLYLYFRTQTPD